MAREILRRRKGRLVTVQLWVEVCFGVGRAVREQGLTVLMVDLMEKRRTRTHYSLAFAVAEVGEKL